MTVSELVKDIMSGFQPPIAVRDILCMDVGTKTRTAEEYCRVSGISDPSRLYEGHTKWMDWDQMDEFYWNEERGVATVWQRSVAAKGKQPVRGEAPPPAAGTLPHVRTGFDSFSRSKAHVSPPAKKFVKLTARREQADDELFVRMDTS